MPVTELGPHSIPLPSGRLQVWEVAAAAGGHGFEGQEDARALDQSRSGLEIALLLLLLSRLSRVQLYVTPIDSSPPGSSAPGILHARILECVAILSPEIAQVGENQIACMP